MVIGDLTGCSCISRWQNPPLTKPSYKKSFVQSCDQIVLGVVHHCLQPQRAGVEEATLPTVSVNPPAEIRSRSALRPAPPPLPLQPPLSATTAAAALQSSRNGSLISAQGSQDWHSIHLRYGQEAEHRSAVALVEEEIETLGGQPDPSAAQGSFGWLPDWKF